MNRASWSADIEASAATRDDFAVVKVVSTTLMAGPILNMELPTGSCIDDWHVFLDPVSS